MGGRLITVEPDGLEARVEALETHVHELDRRVRASEQDAAAARVLAGAADRDVTEFRGELRDFRHATAASFNALRTEMNERFAQVESFAASTSASTRWTTGLSRCAANSMPQPQANNRS